MDSPKRGRGRPRREGADEEILSAALSLLHRDGYRDLTVDRVAEHLGVAKTTIYRRWPTKAALVTAAITLPPPDPANPLASLRALLASDLGPTLAAIIGEGNREVVQRLVEPYVEAIRAATGDDVVAEQRIATLWYRLLVSGEEL